MIVINNLGVRVDRFAIERSASSIFNYLDAFQQRGLQAFIAVECGPTGHEKGLSDLWPEHHPDWWKPNHEVAVSRSIDPTPPNHELGKSIRMDYPKTHAAEVSRRWPANHVKEASSTWPPPSHPDPGVPADHHTWDSSEHETWTSRANPNAVPPPVTHAVDNSNLFPAGHLWASSKTWQPAGVHNTITSRSWWPNHTLGDSSSRISPPFHTTLMSGRWEHQASNSQQSWPPNHERLVSDGWGLGHVMRYSVMWPPNHAQYASNTWTRPQPSWPPSHNTAQSESWGTTPTGPGDWPTWPPGHSWFTTFRDAMPTIPTRLPW